MDTRGRMRAFAALLLGWGSIAGAGESAARATLVIKGMTSGGCVAAVKVGREAESEAPGADAPVATFDTAKLQDWFNRASSSVRIVSLLSPT